MNSFVSTLLLLLVVINGLWGGPKFCDIETVDTVYNVGDNIEFVRCGEVWTYDPNIRGFSGGFTRDYSWWHFAKQKLGPAIIKKMGSYDDKYLIYTGFKIENLECEDWYEDLERDCDVSAKAWNTISMIAINETVVVFKYDGMNFEHRDTDNPFGMRHIQNWFDPNPKRYNFWPYLLELGKEFKWNEVVKKDDNPKISALLFNKNEKRLYVVVVSPDEKYHCLTHLNMAKMLFDTREHPLAHKDNETKRYNWNKLKCFTGNIVGMFEREGSSYIVGNVLENERIFEDQLYSMKTIEGSRIDFEPVNIPGYDYPHSLRTYFGCPINYTWYEKSTPPKPTPIPSVNDDVDQDDTRRKRRSVQEPVFHLKWSNIITEIKEDWIQLSVMTSVALFMIYRLLTLKR